MESTNSLSLLKPAGPTPNAKLSANARLTPGSSSSSSDFATFLNAKKASPEKTQKKEPLSSQKSTLANSGSNPISKPSAAKSNSIPERADNEDAQAENNSWPSQPKGDLVGRLPERMDSAPGSDVKNVSRQESPNPSAQARVAAREFDESVDNLAHRQALQQLLKRMKEEFGLDAEDVVVAFAALTPQELNQPPEANLEKLIQALPLDPGQQAQARLYFEEMLRQTAADDMAGYLKSSHRQLSLEVLSQKEARNRAMTKAVDQMQSQFFAPLPAATQNPMPAKAKGPGGSGPSELNADSSSMGMIPAAMPALNPLTTPVSQGPTLPTAPSRAPMEAQSSRLSPEELQAQLIQLMEPVETQAPVAPPVVASSSAPKIQAPKNEWALSGDVTETLDPESQIKNSMAKALVPPAPVVETSAAAQSVTPSTLPNFEMPSTLAMIDTRSGGAMNSSDESGGEEALVDWSAPVAAAPIKNSEGMSPLKTDSFIVPTQPTPHQEAANIKEIISQAKFLAHKGGGEMKVTLSPEGLGEITMKVAVKSGQVNVEMVAESRDVKRMLEKGLGDLKATLIANNLRVDQIKVDTPHDVSRQLTQNHDEAQRQFAQQFMDQFRQSNNEWRRGLFDIPGAKAYRSQRDEAEGGRPVETSSARRSSARRLDLVA